MEQIKDFGGGVNKDVAFTKATENTVYHSENFRITTDDGGTYKVRTVIKGTEQVVSIPKTPCIKSITFDINKIRTSLIINETYSFNFLINDLTTVLYTFVYSSETTFINDLVTFINTNDDFIINGITASQAVINNTTGTIVLQVAECVTLSINSFSSGATLGTYTEYGYSPVDRECLNVTSPIDPTVNFNNAFDYNSAQYPISANFVDLAYQWVFDSKFNWNSILTKRYSINMGVGVYDTPTTTLITKRTSRIKLTDINPGPTFNDNQYAFVINTQDQVNNIFQDSDYLAGPFNFDLSYYVGTKDNMTLDLKVYGYYGQNILDPLATIEVVNIPGSPLLNNLNMVLLHTEANIAQSTNELAPSQVSFTYNFSDTLVNLNGTKPQFYVVLLDITSTGTPGWEFEFYLDYLKVNGPFLDPRIMSISDISEGIQTSSIIGWTILRDDLYLITTDGQFNPDDISTGPFISNTQFWKLSYDKAGNYADPNNYTISLVYNNKLNTTVYRPIANPGMIEARFENQDIKNIYWTDFYNVPRKINVANPVVASLQPDDLNLQPSLSMDLPIVTEVVDGGNLLNGLYQVAYRLKNTNGSETKFSRTSNYIPVITASENNARITSYYPSSLIEDNANKSLKVVINNIDTTYDTIELVTLYYKDANNVPEINIVKESFIPTTGSVEVIITGAEDQVPITVDEFTAFNTSIKRCKTLAAKKQTLFLGNILLDDQIVNFDTRAYRFPINSNNAIVKDEQNNTYTITSDDWTIRQVNSANVTAYSVPETHDCIQKYEDQDPTSSENALYIPNTNILGGEGPNVKYEFITETIKLDNKLDDLAVAPFGSFGPHMTPDDNVIINFNSIDRNFVSSGKSLSNNSSPYVYDIFVGYRRDEMERFGLVFFDELDNPTYVNWIADIRFPHIWMPEETNGALVTSSGNGRTRIETSEFSSDYSKYDTPTHTLYGKPLGIKFTINFSSVPNKYKKAAIVRYAKKDIDRHIIGQGLFLPTYKTVGLPTDGDNVFLSSGSKGNFLYDSVTNTTYNQNWFDCWTLHSPDFLFRSFPDSSTTDKVDVVGLLLPTDENNLVTRIGNNYFTLDGSFEQDNTTFHATKIKDYEMKEGADTPSSIKHPNTNNPYPVMKSTIVDTQDSQDRLYDIGLETLTNFGITGTRRVNNCAPKDPTGGPGGGIGSYTNAGFSKGSKSLFIQLEGEPAYDWQFTNFSGNGFMQEDVWVTNTQYNIPNYIANYKKTVALPFGGQGYFARSNSEYIGCNNLIDISNKTAVISSKVFGGDTAITVMDHVTQFFDLAEANQFAGSTNDQHMHVIFFPCETNIAVDYRTSRGNKDFIDHTTEVPNRTTYISIPGDVANQGWYDGSGRLSVKEFFNVDPVFNHTDKSVYRYFPKPALTIPSKSFDCRVWKSRKKIDGELVEAWSFFDPEAYLDVESAYGPINNLLIFQDKLYYFQDRGFGVLQVSQQKLLNESGEPALALGESGILERYDYVSTETGTKHQFGMNVSDYSMIWFDTLSRKIYRYKPGSLEPVSDIKGINAEIYNFASGLIQTNDNPYLFKGITTTYDYRHNEFYITFLNNLSKVTWVYNDLEDCYVGNYTHYPKVYINDKVNIFSIVNSDTSLSEDIHIHNYGDYGRFYNSRLPSLAKISVVVNENPTTEKVLTNLELVAEGYKKNLIQDNPDNLLVNNPVAQLDNTDFFNSIRIFNNTQNTGFRDLLELSRKHKTIWNVKIPSDKVISVNENIFDPNNLTPTRFKFTRRLKDKWFIIDLVYDNLRNNKFVIHAAKCIYTLNSR